MHKVLSSIATFELHDNNFWEIILKPNSVLSLEDVAIIYQYIESMKPGVPTLMDLSPIAGIEFEALEFISRIKKREHQLVVASGKGSIGEKYVHLINQLSDEDFKCMVFNSIDEARNWILNQEPEKS